MEEVVIAGMSGKLPESENLQEFWANLIGGVDMVTDDDRRWKAGECPLRIRQQNRSGVYCQGTSWRRCLPVEIPV
ncbi:Fatty acid synthase [Lemmus lemmus]